MWFKVEEEPQVSGHCSSDLVHPHCAGHIQTLHQVTHKHTTQTFTFTNGTHIQVNTLYPYCTDSDICFSFLSYLLLPLTNVLVVSQFGLKCLLNALNVNVNVMLLEHAMYQ